MLQISPKGTIIFLYRFLLCWLLLSPLFDSIYFYSHSFHMKLLHSYSHISIYHSSTYIVLFSVYYFILLYSTLLWSILFCIFSSLFYLNLSFVLFLLFLLYFFLFYILFYFIFLICSSGAESWSACTWMFGTRV